MSTSSVAVAPAKEKPASGVDFLPPVVLDLGKTRKKYIRALKDGEGKLMDDVTHAVEAVRSNLGAEVEGKILVPVVIIYEKRVARKSGLLPFSF
jgi:hypothetical protein